MIKKLAILFAVLSTALGLSAQLPVGGWTIHTPFNGVSEIAETKGMTYFLSAGSLFSVDKSTQEVRALNIGNVLNGAAITGIYPHPDGKYLLVAYDNCNIDKLLDDGSVINISDIKDALLTGRPAINHIGFGKDRFYVAASFGLVTMNDSRNETIETMFTPEPVNVVFGMGDNLVIHYARKLRSAPQSGRIVSLDNIPVISDWEFNLHRAMPVGDSRLVMMVGSANNPEISVADFDFASGTVATSGLRQNNNIVTGIKHLFPIGNDKVATSNESTLFVYDAACPAATPAISTFPAVLKGNQLSAFGGLDEVWAGNAQGVCRFDISVPGETTQLGERFGKTNFATNACKKISLQPDNSLLFWNASNFSGEYLGYTDSGNLNLTRYDNSNGFSFNNPDKDIPQPTWIIMDPKEPGTYYIGAFWQGFYRIRNGKIDKLFTNKNSGISLEAFFAVSYMVIDDYDNLWVAQETPYTNTKNLHVIPMSEMRKEEPSINAWTSFDIPFMYRTSNGTLLSKSDMIAFTRGEWGPYIGFFKHNGTPDIKDNTYILATKFIDQDNKQVEFVHVPIMVEDKKGRLWVGTNNGVFEITDPTKVSSDVVTVNHLKVPRNDGTGLADYLMDALTVTGIAVDSSNRKWISTLTSGVYLVSENGDQILEHYTTDNSILPSNTVYSVACDPNSSSVFFATQDGVAEYNSTSAPPAEDLDNVYAFPNPVRPDYTGWITVTGLMDNTLVKIADSAGNVFFQGRSEGGMITWDGCNANGDRVKTGVYYVFASSGTSNDSNGDSCVTKIMVIN